QPQLRQVFVFGTPGVRALHAQEAFAQELALPSPPAVGCLQQLAHHSLRELFECFASWSARDLVLERRELVLQRATKRLGPRGHLTLPASPPHLEALVERIGGSF